MPRTSPHAALRSALALAALFVAGCDSGTDPECVVGTDPACTPAGQDEVVAGINLTALFAAPTQAERDSVAVRLARTGGTAAPRVASAVATELAPDADATRYVLLDLRDADGRSVAFALARVPAVGGGPNTPLPVLFVLPDGAGNASEGDFLTGATAGGLDRQTVQIAVAFRGAALMARGVSPGSPSLTRASQVPADPYRADVVDVLALVDRLALVPRANAARLGVVGVGRGGAVALLAAERHPARFRAVSSLGAPTSLFDPSFRTAARSVLLGRPAPPLPAAGALLAPVLALREGGGQIGLAEARLRLLEISAITLADRLPATLAFHADPDDVVPTAHLRWLQEQGDGPREAPRRFMTFEDVDHETLPAMSDVQGFLAEFLLETL